MHGLAALTHTATYIAPEAKKSEGGADAGLQVVGDSKAVLFLGRGEGKGGRELGLHPLHR